MEELKSKIKGNIEEGINDNKHTKRKKYLTILVYFIVINIVLNLFVINRYVKFEEINVWPGDLDAPKDTVGQIRNMEELQLFTDRLAPKYNNAFDMDLEIYENNLKYYEDKMKNLYDSYNINEQFFKNHSIFYCSYNSVGYYYDVEKVRFDALTRTLKFIRYNKHENIFPATDLTWIRFEVVNGKFNNVRSEFVYKNFWIF